MAVPGQSLVWRFEEIEGSSSLEQQLQDKLNEWFKDNPPPPSEGLQRGYPPPHKTLKILAQSPVSHGGKLILFVTLIIETHDPRNP